jgi:hypothetical protein
MPASTTGHHSLTAAEAIFVALAAGRGVGPHKRPDAPQRPCQGHPMCIVRAVD